MEVLVPYVSSKYWLLFILTHTRMLHLDSLDYHKHNDVMEYMKRVRTAWELIHESQINLSEKWKFSRRLGLMSASTFVTHGDISPHFLQ